MNVPFYLKPDIFGSGPAAGHVSYEDRKSRPELKSPSIKGWSHISCKYMLVSGLFISQYEATMSQMEQL